MSPRNSRSELDVVGTAFLHSGAGDLDKGCVSAELIQVARAKVAHARSQSAYELNQHVADLAFERDHAFNTLGNHIGQILLALPARLFATPPFEGRSGGSHSTRDL